MCKAADAHGKAANKPTAEPGRKASVFAQLGVDTLLTVRKTHMSNRQTCLHVLPLCGANLDSQGFNNPR